MRSSVVGLLVVAALLATSAASAWEVRGTLRQTGNGYKDCDPTVQQWSGYFDIPGKNVDKHYFYWGFGPRNGNPNAPIILWLTGGPGCSSSLALLTENGPCLMNESSGELYRNAYSWNNEAYLFFLDQPTDVGYSYGEKEDYDGNQAEVSEDIYNFMQRFFEAHKEWRTHEFFIVGESYAGHYVPAAAHRIFVGNERGDGPYINLMGMSVGNGLTDSYRQYPIYPWLAYDWCIEKIGEPCVEYPMYLAMESVVPSCQEFIAVCNSDNPDADSFCSAARYVCNPLISIYANTGRNVYDIRKMCEGDLCYPMDELRAFLNREDVQRELGVEPMEWTECNFDVYEKFEVDWFKNFSWTIPPLIENGIRVMLYAGDVDYICNWMGNKEVALNIEWNKKDEFSAASDKPWTSEGKTAGVIRSVSDIWSPIQFSFVQVYDAGHMVPMDQPEASLTMIHNFIFNRAFQ